MRKIPLDLIKNLDEDPAYKKCLRFREKTCQGRITWEHPFTYGGKQINEPFAIVPLCARHHGVNEFQDGGNYIKGIGQLWGLRRATPEELERYPRGGWERLLIYLEDRFGEYLK